MSIAFKNFIPQYLNLKRFSTAMILALFCVVAFYAAGKPAVAETSSSQQEQIQQLIKMIAQIQARLAEFPSNNSDMPMHCIQLSQNLYRGLSDTDTAGQVSSLQKFLKASGYYADNEITGFFGPVTEKAVQDWQKANGVVSAGSPATTGFGMVGGLTRGAMARGCVPATPKPVTASGGSNDEERMKNVLGNMRLHGELYYDDTYNSYVGFCAYTKTNKILKDALTGIDYTCGDSATEYAVSAQVTSGMYYCIDSKGYAGEINSLYSKTRCVKPMQSAVSNDSSDVELRADGYGNSNEIVVTPIATVGARYFPSGDIDECSVIAKYSDGRTQSVQHSWPNAITLGQEGIAYFKSYGEYPSISLTKLSVECTNERGRVVASDEIRVTMSSTKTADYKIIVGNKVESGRSVSEVEARSRCLKEANALENRLVQVQCVWNGDTFYNAVNSKG